MPQLRNKTFGEYATGGENYSNTCEAMSSNKKMTFDTTFNVQVEYIKMHALDMNS